MTRSDDDRERGAIRSIVEQLMKRVLATGLALLACQCGNAAPPESAGPNAHAKAPGTANDDARSKFLSSCARSDELLAYCGCAFDVTSKDYPDLLDAEKAPSARVEAAKAAVGDACTARIPEPYSKARFLSKCAADDASFGKYCECSWTEYRKTYSPAAIAQGKWRDVSTGGVTLKAVAKECSPQLSEEKLLEVFRAQCATTTELGPFCDCTWKEVRHRFSLGEIVLDAISWPENQSVAVDVYAKCDKSKPKESTTPPKKSN